MLDYDDLLLFWRALGATHRVGQDGRAQFEHVLVDEYQDTNPLQAQILQSLRGDENRNLMVVGDDAQAIYASAPPRSQHPRFSDALPGRATHHPRAELPLDAPDPRRLERRHRATPASGFRKTCGRCRSGGARPLLLTCADESEQSAQVCGKCSSTASRARRSGSRSVLFRTGHHSDLLELELTRRNIPFVKYGGLKFLEAAHIKDVLAILRLLENPRDEVSWFRVLQLLDGIGPASARVDHASPRRRAAPSMPTSAPLEAFPPRQRSLQPQPLRPTDRPLVSAMSATAESTPKLIDAPPRVPEAAREASIACAKPSPIACTRRARCHPRPKSRAFDASASRSSSNATAARRRACTTSTNSSRSPARYTAAAAS